MASFRALPTLNRSLNSETKRQLQKVAVVAFGLLIAVALSAVVGAISNGWLVILGAVAVVAGLMMVVRPPLGMFVLIVFIYLDLSNIIEINWGIPSLNKLLVALIFVAVIGTRAIIQRKPIVIRATEGAIILYGFIIAFSMFVHPSDIGFKEVIDYAKDFAIVLIVVQVSDDEKAWKTMQWTILFCAAFLSSLTCYHMLSGDTSNNFWGLANAPVHEITAGFDSVRPTGPLVDPNFYAQILLMVFPIGAYRVVGEKKLLTRGIALACSALIVGAIIFTYSRSAFIMILVISVLIVLERKMNIYKTAALAVAVLICALPILPKGYLDRMATLSDAGESANGQTEASLRGRSGESEVAILMFSDYPLLGIGYSNYEANYLHYSSGLGIDGRNEERQAHNLYLETAAETGVIGLFGFSIMYLLTFRSLWIARKQMIQIGRSDLVPWATGLALGLLGYLLTSIFLHDDYVRYLRLMIGMALSASALSEALLRKYNQEKTYKALVASPYEGISITDSSK